MPVRKSHLPKTVRDRAQRKSKYRPGLTSLQKEEIGKLMFFESKAGQEYLAKQEKEKAINKLRQEQAQKGKKSAVLLKAKLLVEKKARKEDKQAAKMSILRFLERFAERDRGSLGARYDLKYVKLAINQYPEVMREIRQERPALFREIIKEFEQKRNEGKGKK
ncbi:MAG: hypothetical protein AABW59_01240 [archaeon]